MKKAQYCYPFHYSSFDSLCSSISSCFCNNLFLYRNSAVQRSIATNIDISTTNIPNSNNSIMSVFFYAFFKVINNIHHCVIEQVRLLNLSLIMPFDISIFLTPSQSTCGLSPCINGHPNALSSIIR